MEPIFGIFGVVGSIAGVAAVWLAYLERRERRRDKVDPEHVRYREPRWGTSPPTQHPTTGSTPRPPWPNSTDPRWPPRMEPQRAAEGFAVAWRSLIAYLFASLGGLVMHRSRWPVVRFHAWQSIGIDIVWLAWIVIGLIITVIYQASGEPFAAPAQQDQLEDPVYGVIVAGVIYLQLLPRTVAMVQVIRGRPGRIPLLWRVAARRAGWV